MITIHRIFYGEIPAALDLIREVFAQCVAPDYEPEGIAMFEKSISDPAFIGRIRVFGAYEEDKMVGVIATRSEGKHIALFFVDAEHQGRGVGKALFARVLKAAGGAPMTVNASPFAVEIYRKLGFVETSGETVRDGIRYTPMRREAQASAEGTSTARSTEK